MACVWSVLPGFTYQVLIVLLGYSRSGWAGGMHKMTKTGIFALKELRVQGARRGESEKYKVMLGKECNLHKGRIFLFHSLGAFSVSRIVPSTQ